VPDPTNTRTFSIYLLKNGFDAESALDEKSMLGDPISDATLPIGATLYLHDGVPKDPWWKLYFDIRRELKQTSKSALVFLKADERTFALCFGHVAHNLRDDSYEYDFGLRITLNCVDPLKLKNTDIIEPGAARRQRTQVSVDSDLTYFDFESDSAVLRSLTGAVKTEYADLIKNVTGSSNLRISTKTRVENLPSLCSKLLELYAREDFKTAFPEVQNITPVRDPDVIADLDEQLIAALRSGSTDPLLAVPELLEYNDSFWISFAGAGKSDIHHDVYLQLYYDYLAANAIEPDSLNRDAIGRHKLLVLNDDFTGRSGFSIYKSLIFDTSLADQGGVFHLMEGNWFRFDDNYVSRMTSALTPYLTPALLPNCTEHLEGDYNIAATNQLAVAVCLDKGDMSPRGQTAVEPCDILLESADLAIFVHVKFSTASAQLSHPFNQGSNAMELLKSVDEVPHRLETVIRARARDASTADRLVQLLGDAAMAVHYAIVTHKDPATGVENLPLFSRMSLWRATRAFRAMSVPVTFGFVPNDAPDRPGTPKPRKPRTPKAPTFT
jgi:uncharacterized protein (TIGR04141 family)